jgi:hypothetical protein
MSYTIEVLKDNPLGFWPLDESSGTTIVDRSSCGNNGSFSATITNSKEIPLVYGISKAFKNNNKILTFNISKNLDNRSDTFLLSNDNDFSLEAWIYPKIQNTAEVILFADENENVKIYYDNGTIFFSVYGDVAKHTIPNISQSLYIVGTYTPSQISLYIDGDLVDFSIKTSTFNESVSSFTSGPTASSSDYYLANAFAIYRYALTEDKIKLHYNSAQSLFPLQVVLPNSGQIFELSDDNLTTQFTYSYPANRSWYYFNENGLYVDPIKNNISIPVGEGDSQTIEITDLISIPSGLTINDSKIEWDGDNGITIESSLDNDTYTECVNGQSIPGYQLTTDGDATNTFVYLKITFTTTDDSKYNPNLNYLLLNFYSNQTTYSTNSANYIKPIEPTLSYPTINFALGNYKHPILSRHNLNGINVLSGSGFNLYTASEASTIEFFYTPTSTSTTMLFQATGASYGSSGASAISSTGISKIFVNGEDKTSETSISNVLSVGKLHHIIITLTSPVSGTIRFHNSALSNGLYQNICLYGNQLTEAQCLDNYLAYTKPSSISVSESGMSLTEDSVEAYNNDWLVIQNS